MRREVSLRYAILAAVIFNTACGGNDGIRANVEPQPMPAQGSFTGVWFSPQYGRMDFVQQGKSVIGKYTKDERTGKIQGSAKGNLMRFSWEEVREMIPGRPTVTKGRGYFRLIVDRDTDQKLIGEWGHDKDEVGGGPWNAVKSRKLRPEIQFVAPTGPVSGQRNSGTGTDRANESDSEPATPPASDSNDVKGQDDLGPL